MWTLRIEWHVYLANSCSINSFEMKYGHLESVLVWLVSLYLNRDFELINEHLESMSSYLAKSRT